jgi:hypothetical protein
MERIANKTATTKTNTGGDPYEQTYWFSFNDYNFEAVELVHPQSKWTHFFKIDIVLNLLDLAVITCDKKDAIIDSLEQEKRALQKEIADLKKANEHAMKFAF